MNVDPCVTRLELSASHNLAFAPDEPKLAWQMLPESIENLSPQDQMLFQTFGQGSAVTPLFTTVHHAFEAQVWQRPDAIAIDHLGDTISYIELERQANRLACLLQERGVQPGDNVALFVQRSIEMVVGQLACLKIGAAYVPQCAGIAPAAQLQHVLDAASIKVVLTLSSLREHLCDLRQFSSLNIDEVMREPMLSPDLLETFVPQRLVQSTDICFVLFTSGTTGNPNGVMVTHGNVANIILTAPGNLGIEPGMKVAQLLNIGFDMAAWEVLGALTHGATLLIRGKDFQAVAEQADVLIATPSILATIDANRCKQVKVVALAGEPCPLPLAKKWAGQCRFYNACGPTEVTIVNTMQHYTSECEALTIGKPTPNNTVYILDELHRPLPIGEVGEMWAGGHCVTKGYIANESLTAERYLPDPFLGGEYKMFRTRDLGRWTADGQLEHLGRVDDQVKVRGFRVELDSISTRIEKAPYCEQAVTLKLNDRELVAFVTPTKTDIGVARELVATHLPYYCMPSMVFAMEKFPMTARGKIDKRALLAIAEQQDSLKHVHLAMKEAA